MSASAGRVLLQGKGDYVAATTYSPLDWVRYQGASYVCKAESTGNAPTNTTYWNLLVQDGEEGQVSLQMLKDTVGWKGKNLFHIPSDAETSKNGVAYTYNRNADGEVTSVVAERTSTSSSTSGVKWAEWTENNYPYKGDVILSGCPSDGSNTSYCLELYDGTNRYYDTGNGVTIPYNTVKNGAGYIRIRIDSSYSGNAQTFYPMIRLASVTDDTFEPYHEDVDTCKANTSALAPVENGTTASQAYAQGAHFMRNGQFATAKSAIASGATLTENSNYTVGTVGDSLGLEVLTLVISDAATEQGITFDSTRKVAIRWGHMVSVGLRFTVANTITLSSQLGICSAFPLYNSTWLPPLTIADRNSPYALKDFSGFVSSSGSFMLPATTIEAGTYDIRGTYICK